jgi:hypothetical protein
VSVLITETGKQQYEDESIINVRSDKCSNSNPEKIEKV